MNVDFSLSLKTVKILLLPNAAAFNAQWNHSVGWNASEQRWTLERGQGSCLMKQHILGEESKRQ